MLDILSLIVGLILLTAGAEALVRGSSSLGRHLGLTPLVIGLTVVAFGTSAPEMLVSVSGALQGHGDIAVGNVVGSNIFNVGAILGISAILCPLRVHLQVLKLDAPLLIPVSLGAAWLVSRENVSRWMGALLVCLLVAYTVFSIYQARREASGDVLREFEVGTPGPTRRLGTDALLILVGLGMLVLGSRLLVNSSMSIARALGVREAVVGLTIVAAGTSMPEFATSIVAALRRHPDIAVGNIVGSNLFNVLGILGVSTLVSPLEAPGISPVDTWVMVAFAVALLPLLWTGQRLQRWEGGLLIGGYVLYVWTLWPS
ncbi:calcium/sodium antiporter [bacterium]|nr:calcium/sodium antiporter [bacterium]